MCSAAWLLSARKQRRPSELTRRWPAASRDSQPSKALNKTTLTKDFRRVAKTIVKTTKDNFYRPDLTNAVLAKWSLIHASQKRIKAAAKK